MTTDDDDDIHPPTPDATPESRAAEEPTHDTASEPELPSTPEAGLRRQLLEHLLEHWYTQDEILRVAILTERYEKSAKSARELTAKLFAANADDLAEGVTASAKALKKRKDLTDDLRAWAVASELREHATGTSRSTAEGGYSAIAAKRVRDRRKDMGLMSAQLVALIADFELFVLRVTSSWLAFNSDHLAGKTKELTFKDITELDSLDELRESMVQSFLEDHMRKSAAAWFTEFGKLFGVQKIEGVEDFETLEPFQRRHIIVHHGGLVSRQYLDALSKFKRKHEIGDELAVDLEYLKNAATALACVAHSITLAALVSSTANKPVERVEVEHEIGELSYILLTLGRNKVVNRFVANYDLARVSRVFSREQIRVNGWIAKRRLGKLDEVRSQIEQWDVSAAADDFKLAKLVLLGNDEDAVAMAARMIREGRLSAYAVAAWPLFEQLRDRIFGALDGNESEQESSGGAGEPAQLALAQDGDEPSAEERTS